MRIAVTGTQCIGKSTFIDDFISRWPMYKKPSKSYRDIITEKNIKLNREGDREGQFAILDALCEQAETNADEKFCIHDRCVIDNLAYTLWLAAKNQGGVQPQDFTASIIQAQQSLKYYDVIFFLPISQMSPIPLEERVNRDIDENYREEIDSILKTFNTDYIKKNGKIFPSEECPAVIEIFGNRMQRIDLTSLYIKPNGQAFGEEDGSLITMGNDPNEMSAFEKDQILQQVSK
jgi:hypothetical protein